MAALGAHRVHDPLEQPVRGRGRVVAQDLGGREQGLEAVEGRAAVRAGLGVRVGVVPGVEVGGQVRDPPPARQVRAGVVVGAVRAQRHGAITFASSARAREMRPRTACGVVSTMAAISA